MYGLFGRIQKDRFMDSHGEDKEALDLAIQGYREGLKIDANEYLLVNVATLLVIKGMDLETSAEMRKICKLINIKFLKLISQFHKAYILKCLIIYTEAYNSAVKVSHNTLENFLFKTNIYLLYIF